MKKLLSFVITCLLVLSVISPAAAGIAMPVAAPISAAEFARLCTSLASEYDGDLKSVYESTRSTVGVQAYSADAASQDDTASSDADFALKRLILRADGAVNSMGAVAGVEGFENVHIFQYATVSDAKAAYEYYKKLGATQCVAPDKIISLEKTTENFGAQVKAAAAPVLSDGHLSWGSALCGFDIANTYISGSLTPAEVIVAIVDSGVEETHEFFAGRIIPSTHNYSSTGTADSAKDDNGHGTHVAGIIVDNTTANVKVKGYKVLDSSGYGTISALCSGIAAATADRVDVINLSLSDDSVESPVDGFIESALKSGICVTAASGNESANADLLTPARIADVITVAACNSFNAVTTFSNYGNCVDIAAPGKEIVSTYLNNSYASLDGTSMATPFVSAAAAVMRCVSPDISPYDIQARLKDSANALDNPARLSYAGSGVLCVYDALDTDRLPSPVLSINSGTFTGAIKVSMSCADANAKIYYSTDGSIPTPSTGKLYTAPVTVSDYTKLSAAAFSADSFPSRHVTAFYRILNYAPDSALEINSAGVITEYSGSFRDIIIRDTVKGIKVTGVASSAFGESEIMGISLPEGVTAIPEYGFYMAQRLRYVNAPGVLSIGNSAFYSDINLREINAPKVTAIQKLAFYNCVSLSQVIFDKLTSVGSNAFGKTVRLSYASFASLETVTGSVLEDSGIEKINLPAAKVVERNAFNGCNFLEYLDLPSVTEVKRGVFNGTVLKRVDFSSIVTLNDIPSNGATLALPSSYKSCGVVSLGKGFTVYGTQNTQAQKWASNNSHTFKTAPAILVNLPAETVEGETICVDAIGFNRTYQWYSYSSDNPADASPIAGATGSSFTVPHGGAKNYYCVIKSTDGANIKTLTSSTCVNENYIAHGETSPLTIIDMIIMLMLRFARLAMVAAEKV
ncbi:MAG: S8 family serine peptidase [Clostridiales bacterium]|nr:S8 family serine peptidase [Clostridiales bacterium]